MKRIMKVCIHIVLLVILFANVLLLSCFVTSFGKDISDAPSVDSKIDCLPGFAPCFFQCCFTRDFYCDYLSQTCKPLASNRFLNFILLGSSDKDSSYSAETDVQNDASDTTCLDTETQCAGGCCPYSNASCCSETCCRQGTICLDPLNTCLGIKSNEKTNSNPVLYTEKAIKLQVKSCPPFMIPCFGDCCAPNGMHCDSERRTCVPNDERTFGRTNHFFRMIKMHEKTNSNPVVFSEKAIQLRQVTSCPPFWIPCFGYCCPPIGMHCDSQRQACAPNDERASRKTHHFFRMIQNA